MKVEITAAYRIGEVYGRNRLEMTTIEQLGGLTAQHSEIIKRVINGSLNPISVKRALQDIIEGKFDSIVNGGGPSWYVSPEEQLERVKRISAELDWGFTDADFPSQPEKFTPSTATEVLLLSVYLPKFGRIGGLQRTFDDLWLAIDLPNGYDKRRRKGLESDSRHLRLASGTWKPGIRWVAFDPNTYLGLSPQEALEQATASGQTLAGTEVLMAAVLFPDWSMGFDGSPTTPYPNMSGLQFFHDGDGDWSRVPFITRWEGGRRFILRTVGVDGAGGEWSSPVVREC